MCVNCCFARSGRCCAYCLDNLLRGYNYPGHRGYNECYPFIDCETYMALVKPTVNGAGGAVPQVYSDPELKNQYPTLFEYLAAAEYSDGSKRKTATLLVFIELGVCKVCLNDRDVQRQAFVSARTLNEALSVMDDQLQADSVEWRPVKAQKRF